MQFWVSKDSEVPVREQLAAQIRLAILSQELKPGQKLPSTRELARRYSIHSNTVSAAYRDLTIQGWVEMRSGAGIFVRRFRQEFLVDAQLGLDSLIVEFLQLARRKGFSIGEVQDRIKHWLRLQPPDHFLVIDSDPELREILVAEIEMATPLRVAGISYEDCANRSRFVGAIPVALDAKAEAVAAVLPPSISCMYLFTRSVSAALQGEKRPETNELISVLSLWPPFLAYAKSILTAVKIPPDSLNLRDAREPGWQRGLRASSIVIADAAIAKKIPPGIKARVFHILSDDSLNELRSYVDTFLMTP